MSYLKFLIPFFVIVAAASAYAEDSDQPQNQDPAAVDYVQPENQDASQNDAMDQWTKMRKHPELTGAPSTRSELQQFFEPATAKAKAASKLKAEGKKIKSSVAKSKKEKLDGVMPPQSAIAEPSKDSGAEKKVTVPK